MRELCFVDKTFENASSNLYHLSIQISLDGFSFCILDIPKGKYIVLKSQPLFLKRPRLLFMHVRDLINQDELLNLKFKSVEILYSTSLFTLVPQAFHLNSLQDKYLAFNHDVEKGFSTEKTALSRAGAQLLFAMPDNLKEFLLFKYPKATLRHNLFPLIERSLRENKKHTDRTQVHLNAFTTSFELIAVRNGKLLFCNQFEFSNDNDVLFYVLNLFEQMNFSAEYTDLILHGQIPPAEPLFQRFKEFLKRVSFARITTDTRYSYLFSAIPDHYFTSLFGIYKCE